MSQPIDLRFTDTVPPAEEPARTIYTDLPDLVDPLRLSLSVWMYNQTAGTLYFQVDGLGDGWSFTPVNHGAIAAGTNEARNCDQIATRPKPAIATEESITLILRAYSDAGYTTLAYTFSRSIYVVFIDSGDGTWTVDYLDEFDDASVGDWSTTFELNMDSRAFSTSTSYSLSPPRSLYVQWRGGPSTGTFRGRVERTITTPNRNHVFAIVNVRLNNVSYVSRRQVWVRFPDVDTPLIHACGAAGSQTPEDRWLRFVVRLAKATTGTLQIAQQYYQLAAPSFMQAFFDDIMIISKD